MVEIAMSPWVTSAIVLGIGVAVMESTCGIGSAFACNFARCSTPNLNKNHTISAIYSRLFTVVSRACAWISSRPAFVFTALKWCLISSKFLVAYGILQEFMLV